MNHRRFESDFDEFDNLLREIPEVTSGNDYNCFPLCCSSRSSPFFTQFEEQNLPDDLSFGNPNLTPENPQLMFIPSYNSPSSSPCVYDKFDSRKFNPQQFHQGGYFQNFSSGISPPQLQQYMPSSPAHYPSSPAHYPSSPAHYPSSPVHYPSSPAHYPSSPAHYPSLDQSHMNWKHIEEANFQRLNLQKEEYFCLAQRQELFDYRLAEQSNRSLFCNGEDDNESLRSLNGVRKMFNPEKILMRSHLNVGDDSQNRRLLLQNQLNEDLVMSLNNLTVQPDKYNSLSEARGKIFYMAKDQHGCRFLQKKFAEGDETDIEMIFREIIDRISDLMVDPFGNYLVQKLLEVCNEDQRMQIVHSVARKPGLFIKISCDMHG